jgi:hypothetical protein
MSDTSIATAPVEPSVPTQVTIPEAGPQGPSGEVGQQTPSKSLEQIAIDRANERRGAVERALAKAQAQQAERADQGKPDQDKPAVKAQDKPQQPTQREPQPRDRGRFASSQPVNPPDNTGQPAERPSRYAPLADNAPYREAPPRFDAVAKSDWAGVPESVRGAVHQAHQQMERGIQQLQHQARQFEAFYQPLRQYDQLARQQGSSISEALDNFTGMERFLRSDFFGGLDLLINNLDLRTTDGRKATARDVAYHILNQSPEQHQLTQQQNYARAQAMQVGQLQHTVHQLANGLQQMHYQQRLGVTMSEIDKFAATHPRFDEVSGHIKRELDLGFPLPVAYNRAIALAGPGNGNGHANGNGQTHAAQTRNAPAQTREEIDRSISGAPNGSVSSSPRQQKSASNREALLKAARRVRAGV